MYKFILVIVIYFLPKMTSWAQCAVCRSSVESQVSEGETGLAVALNTGIIYLFLAPYLLIGLVGYFWYQSSRKNAK